MNLIEQLNGYDNAKEWYDENIDKEWVGIYHIPKLYLALLEYRRENNIFEVGDKVVYLPNIAPDHNDVYEVCYSKEGMKSCFISHLNFDYKAFYSDIRHATDEEIKVGHRI